MQGIEEIIKKLILPKRSKKYAYKMGVDCAKKGPNLKNCDFSIFSSRENTDEWERGLRGARKPKNVESHKHDMPTKRKKS